jgi:hypothetical protein
LVVTAADVLVDTLVDRGAGVVFGIPGNGSTASSAHDERLQLSSAKRKR